MLCGYVLGFFLRDSKYDYELSIPSPSVQRVRSQREELARPLAPIFLILLLLRPSFLQFENLGFCSLRLVLSNGDMHLKKKKKHDILWEKGSEFSTRIFDQKSFELKTIAPLERVGKNLSINVFYFFVRDSKYDYERVEQSALCTKNASRASAGWFLADAPI